MARIRGVDDTLAPWDEVREETDWSGLLLGNGFSRNIWDRFGYASLFDTATSDQVARSLTEDDIRLFECLSTHNFEMVLSALHTGITVTEALNLDTRLLRERYESIRHALIEAVQYVHLPWANLSDARKDHIVQALSESQFVYSTNYDLLAYWAIMQNPHRFKDYFWSEEFDLSNTEIWDECTRILYLHGGLHLYRRPNGQTLKRSEEPFRNLLDLFGEPFRDAVPLFISEGSAEEKKSSIYRSDYLSFAFSQFSEYDEPLVVFGQSLSETDQHLIDVLRACKGRPISIAIKPDGNSVRERKARLVASLPHADLSFFDAETHPLGAPNLRVDGE